MLRSSTVNSLTSLGGSDAGSPSLITIRGGLTLGIEAEEVSMTVGYWRVYRCEMLIGVVFQGKEKADAQ